MQKFCKTPVMMLKKIVGNISKTKFGIIAFILLMMSSFTVSAHVFEIRYNQALNGSITWYLISYHGLEQCPAEQAGLTINGTNYPLSAIVLGDARLLSPNIIAQDLDCYSRLNPNAPPIPVNSLYVSYGILTTPFIGGTLTVTPYSNLVCFAFCVGGNIVINPIPVLTCPGNVTQNADNGVCNALVTVPSPTVVDNCTYSGGNPEMVTNGDFSAQAANWNNCTNLVEASYFETTYGGSNPANHVAEIDHQPVTLCQNISGFIPGKIYQLKFKASRRTQTPTPATVGAIVKIDGAALLQTVTRTNTSFSLTDETFTFFATQTTHQLTFVPTAGWSGTYGLIVDDISIKKKLGSITNDHNNTGDASGTYPVGTTNVVWTIVDCSGNTATCNQTVEVIDNQVPVITVSNILSCYEAGNFGCNINLGATVTDNCPGATLSSDAPACFPVGTTTVTWTAMDAHGNSSTATQTVTRNPEMQVNICAGPTRTIYIGTTGGVGPFGPQSVNLTSSASGGTPGYTYSWSPAAGLNNPSISNPIASPAVTTTYTLTVTDNVGCTRSLSITVKVLPLSDARCGSGGGIKFKVCHIPPGNPSNPQGICISVNALNAHLTSGSVGHQNCYLGECDQLCFNTTSQQSNSLVSLTENVIEQKVKSVQSIVELADEDLVKDFTVNASPNPTRGSFVLQIKSDDTKTGALVRVIDANGKAIESFKNVQPGKSLRFGDSYRGGNYYVEVIQGSNRKVIQLVKLN